VYSCARCGAPFAATRPDRKYCDECKVNHHNKSDIARTTAPTRMTADGQRYTQADSTTPLSSHPAAWCSACRSMVIWDGGSTCPICGTPWPRRRASKKLRLQVAEHDGWICHRCRKPIDPALPYGHPLALVADHFPVSLGDNGPTIAANLKAAHSLCNSSHKGLGTVPEETVNAMVAAGLLCEREDGSGSYALTPEGERILAERRSDGNPIAYDLIRAAYFWPPHWWYEISDSERALASEIMKLQLDRAGAVLPPE